MAVYKLQDILNEKYELLKDDIKKRLEEFSQIEPDRYFYELSYCLLTPQTSAINALKAVESLEKLDFKDKDINPIDVLNNKENYIRFHNTKAQRLLELKEKNDEISNVLKTNLSPLKKRYWLVKNIKGFGMKEASHFLRNIGYRGLAILDRHILKHLVLCGLSKKIPDVSSVKKYLSVERKFKIFASKINIPMDELDLLFWSYETGIILK